MRRPYSEPRGLIDWYRNSGLKVAKMLSWALKQRERLGCIAHWNRFTVLFPLVLERVTGDVGVSFKELRDHTFETQGLKITPHKLMQRAYMTSYYSEFNNLKDQTLSAYLAVVASDEKAIVLDVRRSFTDEEVMIAAEKQNHECFVCRAKFDAFNGPVGDHIIPHCKGGPTTQVNCAALCVLCNQAKSDMFLLDFLAWFRDNGARGRIRLYGGSKEGYGGQK